MRIELSDTHDFARGAAFLGTGGGGVAADGINSGGKEIIDFLVGVAAQNAMIRVQNLDLRPTQNQTRLGGTITFVGNLQQAVSTNAPSRNVAAARQPRK